MKLAMWSRLVLLMALLASVVGTLPAADASAATIDDLVQVFDPYQNIRIPNGFTEPASDIAQDVQDAAWFSGLVFLPFLIIPQILLLVVIFKFRDRKDGRKPATFVHHNMLEIVWTAIPVVALIIVSIPLTLLLYKTDLPAPEIKTGDPLTIKAYGKQFSWIFEYPDYDITLALENEFQLPMVFEKDRIASMQIASYDVNHAWAVPAFAVKKDAFPLPRWNYTWFTPNETNQTLESGIEYGYYEGQCYELCGADHGKMVFGAIVVEEVLFDQWVRFMRDKVDADDVVAAIKSVEAAPSDESQAALDKALATYFADDIGAARQRSLRFWTAYRYWTEAEFMKMQGVADAEAAQHWSGTGQTHRSLLDTRIDSTLASLQQVAEETVATVAVGEEG